ncbi:PfkB family carbohydrate kinase [Amaricoccus sp.]|uniref:PfkB family carbohydrate kinase n=1 Tax=Amaricoccus sp. TaxID=1872485 RepID=UPI0039E42C7B
MGTTVVCCGSATYDLLYQVERLPLGPGKILPTAMLEVAHGMATSAATAIARLGGQARLIARIGDDQRGTLFLREIGAAGVDCAMVRRVADAPTPLCSVLIDAEGERLVVPYYSPALGSDPGWIPLDAVAAADAVLCDVRWPEGAAVVLDAARAAGRLAVLDADVGPPEVILDLAERASHAVFSEPAALVCVGGASIEESLRALAARLPGFVAVTAGAEGCFWLAGDEVRQLRPPPVEAVDTLAAGDVFHGAFTLALAEGRGEVAALAFATVAASLKCRQFGGRLGAPDRAEVEALLVS